MVGKLTHELSDIQDQFHELCPPDGPLVNQVLSHYSQVRDSRLA